MAFGTILFHARRIQRQYRCRLYMGWYHTYLTSFDDVVIPTLMLDAPLSRTMTGARLMIDLDDLAVDSAFVPGPMPHAVSFGATANLTSSSSHQHGLGSASRGMTKSRGHIYESACNGVSVRKAGKRTARQHRLGLIIYSTQ